MEWKHTQPLLKYHTASQNEHIHIAAWPPLFDYPDDNDDEPQTQTLFSLSAPGAEILSRSYAIETQSFVLHSTGLMSQVGIDAMQLQGNPLFGQLGGGFYITFALSHTCRVIDQIVSCLLSVASVSGANTSIKAAALSMVWRVLDKSCLRRPSKIGMNGMHSPC